MKMKITSKILFSVASVATALVVAGCGGSDTSTSSSTSSANEPKTLAVNMYSREIPYFQEITKGIQEEVTKAGWTVDFTYGNVDPQQQIDQVTNAITKKPDGLIVVPVDENAIVPAITQAKAAGIPVMTMGDNIAESAAAEQVGFLGVNYEDLGKEKAEYIVKQLGGKGKVGVIHGIRGLNFTEAQIKGAAPVWEANPGVTVVDGPFTGGFTSDKGLSATENLLSRAADLNAIMFDNDDIALGGIKALQGRGIDLKDVLLVGTDGGPAALAAVKAGQLDMTVSLCGFKQGKDVVGLYEKLLNDGQAPPPITYTPTLEFTPENIGTEIAQVKDGDC